jgi:NH3-dependent NAD+ synthetase
VYKSKTSSKVDTEVSSLTDFLKNELNISHTSKSGIVTGLSRGINMALVSRLAQPLVELGLDAGGARLIN